MGSWSQTRTIVYTLMLLVNGKRLKPRFCPQKRAPWESLEDFSLATPVNACVTNRTGF